MKHLALAAPAFLAFSGPLVAQTPSAGQLASSIENRPTNAGRTGTMNFTIANSRGRTRERQALFLQSERGGVTKTAIYFTGPGSIRETAFLTHDYETRADQTWLFLPATGRIRRIPSSDDDDYFLGTDLTYRDLRTNFKFPRDEWKFTNSGAKQVGGKRMYTLSGSAASNAVAQNMGYSSFTATIDPATYFPQEITYTDLRGRALKRVTVLRMGRVGNAWTALRLRVSNVQTGTSTLISFTNMKSRPGIDQRLLSSTALDDGIPRIN